ncbi:HAD-IIB family hydrolase [Mesoplasma whartonense]|uniref:HAD-IIB family hydrolase n=1 Tax=Mesoplasma whartonense TaxID=2878854 RepID=UPI0035BE69C0
MLWKELSVKIKRYFLGKESFMKLNNLNKKRLILVDLDGTILTNDGETMHPKTVEVLKEAMKNGHQVCIVTGRPYIASARQYEELGLTTLLTNFDGSHIHDPKARQFKRILFPISEPIIKEILNNPIINDACLNVMTEYYDKAMLKNQDDDLENFFHLNEMEAGTFTYNDPAHKWKGPANNIVLKLKDAKYKDDVMRMLTDFKDAVKIQTDTLYGVTRDSKALPVISLTNKIANKGNAACILAQYYNKDIRDVIAFGDQMNDYRMITAVGYGVAMINGSDTLKTVADGITWKSNHDGGVGYYLEQLLNGEEV